MSVNYAIVYRNNQTTDTDKLMPVAGDKSYKLYWKKPGIELGLLLVSEFEYLYTDKYDIVKQIIDELGILKSYWENQIITPISPDVIQSQLERIDSVIEKLQSALENWDEIDHIAFGG
ncbi:MAG TPA: hypothetical protein VHL11_12870 [Phototrophicaceae bacterium]|nr:hypothetical protein [Phototrophicaceae bacterium]